MVSIPGVMAPLPNGQSWLKNGGDPKYLGDDPPRKPHDFCHPENDTPSLLQTAQ